MIKTKKIILSAAIMLAALCSDAQSIPNYSFENWVYYKGSPIMVPEHWITNDVLTKKFNPAYTGVSVSRLEEPYSGTYALKMEVVIDHGDTVNGGIYSTGTVDSLLMIIYRRKNAGFVCKQRVAVFKGRYVFNSLHGDSAMFGVTLTRWNKIRRRRDTLVNTTLHIGQNAASYLPFVIPLKYHLNNATPDSAFIVIGIQGPGNKPAHRGSMLIIDDLGFEGSIPMKKD